jgi:N-formylglutamate deformylase
MGPGQSIEQDSGHRPEGPRPDAAADATLAALDAEPCTIARPSRQRVPFIFASPHSGRLYPPSFVARSRLGAMALRRSEDAFVDDLITMAAVELGAPVIAARFPRAFLDVNRAPSELDAQMFDGALAMPVDAPSARVQAGLGVIPRVVRDGADIYRDKLDAREAGERLSKLYRPYHAALLDLVEETRAGFGAAVVVDCHSMPSAAAAPDIVLGDRYGIAAAPALIHHAQQAFELRAFTVARNVPYAGGYTTQLYGRPAHGVHGLQIEINRALYLDEERIVPGPRFMDVRLRIGEALGQLVAMPIAALAAAGARTLPWAAE